MGSNFRKFQSLPRGRSGSKYLVSGSCAFGHGVFRADFLTSAIHPLRRDARSAAFNSLGSSTKSLRDRGACCGCCAG